MRNKKLRVLSLALTSVLVAAELTSISARAAVENGWEEVDGAKFWYENGVKQGTEGRGKEIYDSGSDAWYWLDAVDGGKMAVSKDVYQESQADEAGNIGKWVRYDGEGHMIKGWNHTEAGTYYFDLIYGTMAKGSREIDGVSYFFNEETGILESGGTQDGWNTIDGKDYWYEQGVRQGYHPDDPSYRGKEIYDPGSDAWYWLDNVQQGAKAVSKDVYQESQADDAGNIGKWVRYDADGHMVKGWDTNDNGTYYFDPVYGTMAKGIVTIDGVRQRFNTDTGLYEGEVSSGGTHTYRSSLLERVDTLDENDEVTEYYINEYTEIGSSHRKQIAKTSHYVVKGGDILYQVEEYQYNENGDRTLAVTYDVDPQGNKAERYRYEYKYNSLGQEIEYTYKSAENPKQSYRYEYGPHGTDKYSGYDWMKQYDYEDKLIRRNEWDYNGEEQITERRSYEMKDGKERLSDKTRSTYSAGLLVQEDQESYYVNSYDGTEYTSYYRTVYSYEGTNRTEAVTSYKSYDGEAYNNSSRTTWAYDGNGNEVRQTSYNWDSARKDWEPTSKSEYTYLDRGDESSYWPQLTYGYYGRYDENGNLATSPDVWVYESGWENVYTIEGRSYFREKEIYYTWKKAIDYYWVYEKPDYDWDKDTGYVKTDRRFDRNDNQTAGRRYHYTLYSYEVTE